MSDDATIEQLRYEVEHLKAVLQAHHVRQCVVCHGWEKPRSGLEGVGGIQADDVGKDRHGRYVHARCVSHEL